MYAQEPEGHAWVGTGRARVGGHACLGVGRSQEPDDQPQKARIQILCLKCPRSQSGAGADVQTGSELSEYRRWKPLGEDVGILGRSRDMKDMNVTEGDMLQNKV